MMKKMIVMMIFIVVSLQANEIVKDSETGMVWQDSAKIVQRDYSAAKEYCNDLSLGGYSDWKLPTIDELVSIVDKKRYKPAIKKIFKNSKNDYYWSSSEYANDSSRAWHVHFYAGYDGYHNKSSKRYVRCVRVGQ